MDNKFIEFNGGKLNYEVHGKGIPIVLIHGNTLDENMWDRQVKYLSKNYMTIAYDLRGFGKSSPPTESYGRHRDLKAILDNLNINQAVIVGLSLGGDVALDFTLTFPENVLKLILVDSGIAGWTWQGTFKDELELVKKTAREQGVEKAKQVWINTSLFENLRSNPEALEQVKKIVSNYSGWFWLNNDLRVRPEGKPAAERLDEIECPTLVVVGEKDIEDFQLIAELLHSKIANSEKVVISNAGHMCNIENPDEFNNIVEKFIEG